MALVQGSGSSLFLRGSGSGCMNPKIAWIWAGSDIEPDPRALNSINLNISYNFICFSIVVF